MAEKSDDPLTVLKRRQTQVREQLHALQGELRRLDKAIEALSAQSFFYELGQFAPRSPRRRVGTLKQMAYTVLAMSGRPRTAAQILNDIELLFDQKIERTSMSPQLSRLAQDGLILRSGNLWSLNPDRPPEADQYYLIGDGPRLL